VIGKLGIKRETKGGSEHGKLELWKVQPSLKYLEIRAGFDIYNATITIRIKLRFVHFFQNQRVFCKTQPTYFMARIEG
jgi:hypothetical protein